MVDVIFKEKLNWVVMMILNSEMLRKVEKIQDKDRVAMFESSKIRACEGVKIIELLCGCIFPNITLHG